jgi:hypothetical protein
MIDFLGTLLVLAGAVMTIAFRKRFADTIDERTRRGQSPVQALLGRDYRRHYEIGVTVVASAIIAVIVATFVVSFLD